MTSPDERLGTAITVVSQAIDDAIDSYGQKCFVCGVIVAISGVHDARCPVPDFIVASRVLDHAFRRWQGRAEEENRL